MEKLLITTLIIGLALTQPSCKSGTVNKPGETDQYGCEQPPASVLKKNGIDISFAKSTFGKVMLGSIDIQTNPEIIELTSKASNDERVTNYLVCLYTRRDGFTKEQTAWMTQMMLFMRTDPTPEQFIAWENGRPFPSGEEISGITVSIPSAKKVSLKNAIRTAVEASGKSVLFKEDCNLLDQYYVREGAVTARNVEGIIKQFRLRLSDPKASVDYDVEFKKADNVYEISCK